MMATSYKHRIQHLRGTADDLKKVGNSIIPLDGEIVIEFDNSEKRLHKLKIGDGESTYDELPYINSN